MKLRKSILLFLLVSSVTGKNVFEKEISHGKPTAGNVPDGVVEKFKDRAGLKKGWNPRYQKIVKEATSFTIGGLTIDMGTLIPVDNLFSANAKITVNGELQEPTSYIYKSPYYENVRVVLDDNKKLVKATMNMPDDNVIDLVPVKYPFFTEINADEDLDFEQFQDYKFVSSRRK